jgi:uncharacterized membrane protein
MKGVTLFADVVSVLVLLAIIMLSTLLVWGLILLQNVTTFVGIISPRSVELTIFHLPTKYDTTLLALLEYKVQGIAMKRWLEAAAIQESKVVWLDGKTIDAEEESRDFLAASIDNPYLLKIVLPNKELIVVENEIFSSLSRPTSIQETTAKLFLLNGEVVDLKLLVRE